LPFWAFTPKPSTVSEGGAAMIEPILGLVVALALGVYLIITLLHPERF
jgi:K+-transporting ATPase KdpF subunit